MTDINEFLGRLNPRTIEKVKLARDVENSKLPLPSLAMTKALNGGFGRAKQTLIWGNESAGKTTFTLELIAKAQARGEVCGFLDAEKTFDPEWATRLGVNVDELIITQVSTIEEMHDTVQDWIKNDIDVTAIDSISALMPQSFQDDKGEYKGFGQTNQIGQFSRDIGKALRMLSGINNHTVLIPISQVRTNLSNTHASLEPMGGKELGHINSLSVRLWSGKGDGDAIKGNSAEHDLIFTERVGRRVKWSFVKNKINGVLASGDYALYTAGDNVGIDYEAEVLDLAVKYDKITKGGSWYNIEGEKFQGPVNAARHLRQNPDILTRIEKEIL